MPENVRVDFDFNISKVLLVHEFVYQPHVEYDMYSQGRLCYGVVYVVSGEVEYCCRDETVTAYSGDLVFLPSSVSYVVKNRADQVFHHFTANFQIPNEKGADADDGISSILASDKIRILSVKTPLTYQNLFENITSLWNNKKSGYMLISKALLYEILYHFFSEYLSSHIDRNDLDRILPAKKYIDEFYMRELSLSMLSEMCDLSVTHFRRLFKSIYSRSPIDYQINLRLLKAKDLLLTKLYTVNEVADMTGFTDANYFSRIFKKYVGISPLKYKQRY